MQRWTSPIVKGGKGNETGCDNVNDNNAIDDDDSETANLEMSTVFGQET